MIEPQLRGRLQLQLNHPRTLFMFVFGFHIVLKQGRASQSVDLATVKIYRPGRGYIATVSVLCMNMAVQGFCSYEPPANLRG